MGKILIGSDERWENWLQYTQSRYVRTFTPDGYKLHQIPPNVYQKLKEKVNFALNKFDLLPEESPVDAIFNEHHLLPKFVHLGSLSMEVLEALRYLHEEWAG